VVDEPRTPIPEEIKKGIVSLAANMKKAPKDLVEELKTIIDTDETIQTMPHKEFKIRYAWGILLRRYSFGAGTKMVIRPLTRPRPRKPKKWVSDLACIVRVIEVDDEGNEKLGPIQYGAGTIWEEGAKNSGSITPKKVYRTAMSAKNVVTDFMDTPGVNLGGNDATFIESDDELPTVKEFYEKHILPNEASLLCALKDMPANAAQNPTDIRLFNVTVVNSNTGEGKLGEYANFNATDDSIMPQNVTFWLHPDEDIYDGGSTLKVVAAVSYDSTNNKCNTNTHIVIPIIAQKKTVTQPAGQPKIESIPVEDLEDEPVATPAPEPPQATSTPTTAPVTPQPAPVQVQQPAPAPEKKSTVEDDDFAI